MFDVVLFGWFNCFVLAGSRFVVRFDCGNLVLFGGVWVFVGWVVFGIPVIWLPVCFSVGSGYLLWVWC